MSIGSQFYNDRVTSLQAAIDILGPENEHLFGQGLKILESHRNNYGSNPDTLVILWWEWPQLHWPELRMGASMNFMTSPIPGKVPNSEMDKDALAAAICFVDELIALKV